MPGVSVEHDIQPRSPPSLAPSEDDETPRVVLGEDGDFIDVEKYVAEGDNEGGLITTEGELTDDVGAPLRKRKKMSPVYLCDEQKRRLGKWVQEHPFLYYKGLLEFKDVRKKSSLFEAKARSLDPPLTGTQLSTWLRSIRTRYGRLMKVKSGQAVRDLTAREKWILSEFSFFGRHIVRQKKPKTLGLREVREMCFNSEIPIFFFFFVCVYVNCYYIAVSLYHLPKPVFYFFFWVCVCVGGGYFLFFNFFKKYLFLFSLQKKCLFLCVCVGGGVNL